MSQKDPTICIIYRIQLNRVRRFAQSWHGVEKNHSIYVQWAVVSIIYSIYSYNCVWQFRCLCKKKTEILGNTQLKFMVSKINIQGGGKEACFFVSFFYYEDI